MERRQRLLLVELPVVDERSERIARRFELPMLVAALLVIPVLVIEQSEAGDPWQTLAAILNWGIWIAFAVELVVMLVVVPERKAWLVHHPLEVVVVLATAPFYPESLQSARALRLLRLLRLFRIVSVGRRLFSLDGLRWSALLALITALGGGAAFASVEGRESNTWDGVWWAMTTMTTVGYGDLYPETDSGRLIAIGVMLVGIGFVAILTAAVAERFLAPRVEQAAEAADAAAVELEVTETEVLDELRAIAGRLTELEGAVARLGRS